MKIGVINFSGNVGKTTISKYLLQRKLGCDVYSVETINSSDSTAIKVGADKFAELQSEMLLNDDLIVDIGSSNVENLISQIMAYKGSQDDFDFFLIPTINEKKQIRDTIQTIVFLIEDLKVPSAKIKVIYNKVESVENMENDFSQIEFVLNKYKIKNSTSFILDTKYFGEVDDLSKRQDLPKDILENVLDIEYMVKSNPAFTKQATDFKNQSKSEPDPMKKEELYDNATLYANLAITSRLGIRVKENLDSAFQALFGTKK